MKQLIIEVAALSYNLWEKYHTNDFWNSLKCTDTETVFPAVTCSVQASFRTGLQPEQHGMPANGFFDEKMQKPFFWEQSSKLFTGKRIWDEFRKKGGTVGQICWQQSIGTDSDLILSPAPIHKHHGGMIQDFYSEPGNLYCELCGKTGRKFNLFNYWGPFTSLKSSRWICDATAELILDKTKRPDILLTYLPNLDYDLQRYGNNPEKCSKIFRETELMLEKLFVTARTEGYEIIIFGDYAINNVENVVYPNRLLNQNKFFRTRKIKNMLYPDINCSDAFAMVDHQVAHIYIKNTAQTEKIKNLFEKNENISKVEINSNFKNGGKLILSAEKNAWFSYKWWENKNQAPDYASHVDIHNKPGFDPCELFSSLWPPMSVSQNDKLIKGSHGRNKGSENRIFWANSNKDSKLPENITEAGKIIFS